MSDAESPIEMVQYFLDTEFDGHDGPLLSLALVPADPARPALYLTTELAAYPDKLTPWVRENVYPKLELVLPRTVHYHTHLTREDVAYQISLYLYGQVSVGIIAGWSQDIEQFMRAVRPSAGRQARLPPILSTALIQPIGLNEPLPEERHNAYFDAKALRDFFPEFNEA